MPPMRFVLIILMGTAAMANFARAGDFDDQFIPGKWINALLPENVAEPEYASYDKDSALERARTQIWSGQYRRALATLDTIEHGHAARIAMMRGEAQLALGRFAEASATLSLPVVADKPEARVLRANVLAAQGRFDDAIVLVKSIIAEHPDLIGPRYYLGDYLEEKGDIPAARNAYQWFVTEPHNYLNQWMTHAENFNSAADITLMGRAIDRWATLTMAYEQQHELHDIVLGMFVRAYDLIDRDYWPAHVAAAEYFLKHEDPQEALNELRQSLSANPSDIRSLRLVGEIQLAAFNFNATERAIAHIREVDPDSIDADILEARDYLQQRAAEQAISPLKRVLDQQPGNIEALGLLAAAEALRLNDDTTAAILKQVDQLSPNDARAYMEVADQLGAMRQYPRAAEMYKIAIDRAPWWSEPRNGLGLLYTQSGDEDASRTVLSAAHVLDPFNPRTTNYIRLLDTMAGYARKESAHFVVIYDAKADPIIPEYFGEYLESVYPQVCGAFHFEPAVKTLIEVFPTHDEFSVRTTGGPWIATVGASTGRVIALVAPRKGERTLGPFDWSHVLRHEFTHTVTLGATDNRIAHWFTEGLAVQQEQVPVRWEWVPMLYDGVVNHHLLKMDELTWGFIRPRRPIDRQMAYAESAWICQYVEETYGHDAILGMMDGFKRGLTQEDVFQKILHRSQGQFFDEFQAWCRKKTDTWGYDRPSSEKYALLRDQAEELIKKNDFKGALGLYEEIAKIRPVDLLPHRRLAGLYAQTNQPAKEVAQLDMIAAVELKDSTFAKGAARVYRDLGDYPQAVQRATQAVYIDPYDPGAHKLLEECFAKLGNADGVAREKRVIDELEHWQEVNDPESPLNQSN
jgi:cellulose synthase operon protein C